MTSRQDALLQGCLLSTLCGETLLVFVHLLNKRLPSTEREPAHGWAISLVGDR